MLSRLELLSPVFAGALLLSLGGCRDAADDDALAVCEAGGEEAMLVVSALRWSRVDEDGVTKGFDLDDEISSGSGSSGCGVPDYVDEDGAEGIDNVFGSLVPALELTEFSAVEGLIAQSIASGELLITFELSGLDADLDEVVDDECLDVSLARGSGAPLLGTDGTLLPGQTIDRDLDMEPVSVQGVTLDGGTLIASPVDVDLPIQVFDREMVFELKDGAIRLDMHEDGTYSGYFSGGVDVEYVLSIAAQDGVSDDLFDLMEALLDGVSDLNPDEDGDCQFISIALEFEAVPAYFYGD